MFDNVKITFRTNWGRYYRKYICTIPKYLSSSGEYVYYNPNYRDFYVTFQNGKVIIRGSLHKFYKGNNYTAFSKSQIENAIAEFCEIFMIDENDKNIRFTLLEFGLNVPLNNLPLLYAKCMINYKNSPFILSKPRIRSKIIWGTSCSKTDYVIKFYDKFLVEYLKSKDGSMKKILFRKAINEKLLRLEVVYLRPKLRFANLVNLKSLYSSDFLNEIIEDFNNIYENIVKRKKLDTSTMTVPDLKRYYNGQLEEYWEDLHQISPSSHKKELELYKQLPTKYEFKPEDLITELDSKISDVFHLLLST